MVDEAVGGSAPEAEEWRPVVGWEGSYSVSNRGRVRSEARGVVFPNGRHRTFGSRILSDRVINSGYLVAALWNMGIPTYRLVHQLVIEAFIGPIAHKLQVNHKNGVKRDNRLENLEVVTAAENVAHSLRIGLAPRGESSKTSKLKEAQVAEIRARYRDGGMTHEELGAEFGVTRRTIGKIIAGDRWAHTMPAPETSPVAQQSY